MAQTKRDRQVKRALSTRSLQIAATKQQALMQAVDETTGARWWGSGKQPRFCYCTQPVEYIGESGWVSWIGEPYQRLDWMPGEMNRYDHSPVFETVVFHRRRNSAKARAWNLWQGWRLAKGLSTSWRSPDEGKEWTR